MEHDAASTIVAGSGGSPTEPVVIGTYAHATRRQHGAAGPVPQPLRLPPTLEPIVKSKSKPLPPTGPTRRKRAETAPDHTKAPPAAANDAVEAAAVERNGLLRHFQQSLPDESQPQKTIAVMMLDCRDKNIDAVIDGVLAVCARRGMTPVFVTDYDDFSVFRSRGLFFEYIPSAEERIRLGADRNWNLYIERRLDLIKEKWSIDGFVAFGGRDMDVTTSPVPSEVEVGFWRRQVLRLARLAMRPAVPPRTTETPNALSSIAGHVD